MDWNKPISQEKLKQDLDFLFKTIEEVHPNMYAYISQQEFAGYRNQLYEKINSPMTRIDFYKLAAPVVAELRNGHTTLQYPQEEYMEYLKKGGRLFPLTCEWNAGKLTVNKNHGDVEVPLGGSILTINGTDAGELILKFGKNKATEWKNHNPYSAAESLSYFLWLFYGQMEFYELTIKDVAGNVNSYVLPSITGDKIVPRHQDENYNYSYYPEYNTGLIECKMFWGRSESQKSFEEIFTKIKEQGAQNLIIDVRRNPGGDSSVGDALLDYLTDKPFQSYDLIQVKLSEQGYYLKLYRQYAPDIEWKVGSVIDFDWPRYEPKENPLRFNGRVFLLIGPKTFSAATTFAAIAKHYDITTTIGEETIETLTGYGEMYLFRLPNCDLMAGVSQKYFVEAGGKPDGRGVIPDYEVEQKPEDTAQEVDTALQFTLDLITQGK